MNSLAPSFTKLTDFNDLDKVMAPVCGMEFIKEYYEQKLLIQNRNQKEYFSDLLTIEEIDKIIDLHYPKGEGILFYKQGKKVSEESFRNIHDNLKFNLLYKGYSEGLSIVLNGIDMFWQPIKVLCQNLTRELNHRVQCNLYLTPNEQRAFDLHFDTHDVIIIQIHGKKHWNVYDTWRELPLSGAKQTGLSEEELSNLREVTLHAGDSMYIPRGIPHEAFTSDESSIHLTLGIYPVKWGDFIQNILEKHIEENEAFRKSLPPGYLNPGNWTLEFKNSIYQQMENLLSGLSEKKMIDEKLYQMSHEMISDHQSGFYGQIAQIDKINSLNINSILEKRFKSNCLVEQKESMAKILFPGGFLNGPAKIAEVLTFICDSDGMFCLKDLPLISNKNKIHLARKLIVGGLLKFKA